MLAATASTDLQDNKDLLGVEIDMRQDDFDGYVEGFGKIQAVKTCHNLNKKMCSFGEW